VWGWTEAVRREEEAEEEDKAKKSGVLENGWEGCC
jgi:hypothetical protein